MALSDEEARRKAAQRAANEAADRVRDARAEAERIAAEERRLRNDARNKP